MSQGKLIVIEGTDGSGKATQTKLLVDRLERDGKTVFTMSFPQYGKKSAGLVENLLNGKYGPPNLIDPHIASLLYAVDRYDASFKIKKELEGGKIVVLDRYVSSNAGHQGGKLLPPEKIQEIAWKTIEPLLEPISEPRRERRLWMR